MASTRLGIVVTTTQGRGTGNGVSGRRTAAVRHGLVKGGTASVAVRETNVLVVSAKSGRIAVVALRLEGVIEDGVWSTSRKTRPVPVKVLPISGGGRLRLTASARLATSTGPTAGAEIYGASAFGATTKVRLRGLQATEAPSIATTSVGIAPRTAPSITHSDGRELMGYVLETCTSLRQVVPTANWGRCRLETAPTVPTIMLTESLKSRN